MAATTRSDSDTARTIFYVVAVLMAIYGLGLLLFPQAMFTLSDDPGAPANPGWVRWAGGLLLGTAIAAWLAASNPESQRPLIVGLATASSFRGAKVRSVDRDMRGKSARVA